MLIKKANTEVNGEVTEKCGKVCAPYMVAALEPKMEQQIPSQYNYKHPEQGTYTARDNALC